MIWQARANYPPPLACLTSAWKESKEMSSRKTFIRVAQALQLTEADRETVVAVGLALAVDNPRFDLNKFVEAASQPAPVTIVPLP